MFKNVIFDLGNVLLLFDHVIFYDKLSILEPGLESRSIKKFVVENQIDTKLSLGKITPLQVYSLLKKEFNLKTGYRKFCELYGNIFTCDDLMKELLLNIISSKKQRVFLLSNTDAIHFNFIKKNFPFVMKIPNRVLSYKVGLLKPDTKIYKHLLSKYRIKPEETCFIDDIKEHIIAAEKTGITGIHYTSHKLFLKKYSSKILH